MLKRAYHMLALLAMLNLFTIAGLVGFLVLSGRLDNERVEQIAKVLRGESLGDGAGEEAVTEEKEAPQTSEVEIARAKNKREYFELVASRHEREMRDRATLGQRIQLEAQQLLEKLEAQKRQFREEKEQVLEEGEDVGFERQLTLMSKIDPKLARDLLKSHTKEADVVHLLMKMDENRMKGIVNACKTAEEKAWIGGIIAQMGKFTQDEELNAPPQVNKQP